VLGRDENSARNILLFALIRILDWKREKEKRKKEWEEKQQDSYKEDDCKNNTSTRKTLSEAQTLLFR
jgi:hypothetical protein